MRRALVAAACWGACNVWAQAVPWDAAYNPSTRTTSISAPSTVPRATGSSAANSPWGFSTSANGDVYASATGKVPGPLGPATVTAGATMSRSAAVRVLGAFARAIPVVALGGALWDLYQQYGASVGSTGEPVVRIPEGRYVWEYGGIQYSSTAAALAAFAAYWADHDCATVEYGCGYQNVGPARLTGVFDYGRYEAAVKRQNYNANWNGTGYDMTPGTTTWWSPGPGGGVAAVKVTEEVEKPFNFEAEASADASKNVAPALNQAAQEAALPVNIPSMKPEAMPQPQATPWAATAADPAKQERAVYTPVWSEKDQAIRWDKAVETKDAAGNVVSVPDPTASGDASTGGAGEAGVDICAEHPEILACKELGDVEDDQELNRKDKNVSGVTPWGSFGPSNGSCPQYSATFLGQPIAIDFKLVCDGLTWMRPAVIGLAWIMAAYIFIGGIKQS